MPIAPRVSLSCISALCLSLLFATAASADPQYQIDALWWNGEDQFGDGQMVDIHPFAGGDKQSDPSDTLGDGLGTWDLRIDGYSRTWSAQSAGQKKQLDIFLSFNDAGVTSYLMSLRYDAELQNALDVFAVREYNVSVGSDIPQTKNWGLGPVYQCEPRNNCLSSRVVGPSLDGLGFAYLATESTDTKIGWIYRWASLALTGGPETNNSTQVGTIRVGSVVFEYTGGEIDSVVSVGIYRFPGALDSINANDDLSYPSAGWEPISGGPPVTVIVPEPGRGLLSAAALGVLVFWRTRQARKR